ncbi:hypothetical protein [Micromonospora citrea]|uniref:hypothetical protein n=1 Tax=Micromonospora citrea TaxID=47855 RepID=UPI00114C88CD|nr:hypothetical protein [Micromonospora citrea]
MDLVLRATRTGFTHVLTVKTPQAAADPALREIRFDLGGDVRVRRDADGSLRAHAGAVEVARSAPAEMWDSASVTGRSAAGRSSAAGPGAGARTAPVATAIDAAGDLVLRPTPGLLDPAKAAFPVYIDPSWSAVRSRWAYATSDNFTNSDTTRAIVGYTPDSNRTYRSYFEFPTGVLAGKHIQSAYVRMKLDHSWSCFATPTYMHQSAPVASTPRTAWAPALTALRASASASACATGPQPDAVMNFTGSNVTAAVRTQAGTGAASITFGFCACSDSTGTGESDQNRYKKFYPDEARLLVDYDSLPGQPTGLQAGGQDCVAGGRVALPTAPTLSAVFPDADAGQTLQTTYELLEVPASGSYDSSTPRLTPPAGATVTAGARSTTAPVTGVNGGGAYAWRTRSTDAAPYGMVSPWSPWCEFTVDDTAPTVTVDPVTNPAPPGQFYTYKLRSPDSDVVSFRYGWSSPPTEEAEAGTTLGYPGRTVSVTLTTPAHGTNTLYVAAVDSVGNVGYGSVVVQVDPPAAG